jgi:hypothetical protein
MNALSNIDLALLGYSTASVMPNALMNQPVSQDGSGSLDDGNPIPAGEPVYCSLSLFSKLMKWEMTIM